jgi:short subunit dehydrogenase-like uncharacterized protein
MLYGASGFTGALIARHAQERGHQPVLAGRNASKTTELADHLNLSFRVIGLDDPSALHVALKDVEVVLNAAGPFLNTATPLAEACLNAGVHYLDISNELQVFRSLYDLNARAQRANLAIIPGVGFGVVATNCLARYVADAVGGAQTLEVGARAVNAVQGPGVVATVRANFPYGGWVRQAGRLQSHQLGSGTMTIGFPDGPFPMMPVPTGDLEAAYEATGAASITAYSAELAAHPALDPASASDEAAAPEATRSFGWARATSRGGATAQAWLQTGESYAFTAAASIRAVEQTLAKSPHGAISPAAAFGSDFALTIDNTIRIDD